MGEAWNSERFDWLVLAWLYCQAKPKTADDIAKGLKAIAPAATLLPAVEQAIHRRVQSHHAAHVAPPKKGKAKPKLQITLSGRAHLAQWIGWPTDALPPKKFPAVLSAEFPAKAMSLKALPKSAKEANVQLAAAVCVEANGLDVSLDDGPKMAKQRLYELAMTTMFGPRGALPQFKKPPYPQLAALIVASVLNEAEMAAANLDNLLLNSACRALDVGEPKLIRLAIVRRWLNNASTSNVPPLTSDTAPFAQRVLTIARDMAHQGAEGVANLRDKVLIHPLWRRFVAAVGDMPLAAFKLKLADANGESLHLAGEDLIPDERRTAFAESEVRIGASAYHYVRC